ncbi:hypothetical protein HBH98_205700 [Parastagonospora nodorum]|nr:hypothetical protein HBH53_197400 [Parastagonospora nodorum]KAH3966724.1 hypothetical protein HBH52_194770 [Parastagonospora nodorum]KAH3992812.1 hypothetical protein HBI10_212860 [Parastagonospora nodorum]KAH4029763.1 hypothetical protein HBI13_032170 [Parastagonospora nodorum]KAH4076174.1 hypothetical protein HBH50_001560 [Parastagonospora nodorum]
MQQSGTGTTCYRPREEVNKESNDLKLYTSQLGLLHNHTMLCIASGFMIGCLLWHPGRCPSLLVTYNQEFRSVMTLLSYDLQVPLDYDSICEFLREHDASCEALNSRTFRDFSHKLVDHLSSFTDPPCATEAASSSHQSTLLFREVIHFTGDTDSNEEGDADDDADKRAFALHESAALANELIDLTGDAAEKLRRAFPLSLAEEASLEDVVLPDGILISGPQYCQLHHLTEKVPLPTYTNSIAAISKQLRFLGVDYTATTSARQLHSILPVRLSAYDHRYPQDSDYCLFITTNDGQQSTLPLDMWLYISRRSQDARSIVTSPLPRNRRHLDPAGDVIGPIFEKFKCGLELRCVDLISLAITFIRNKIPNGFESGIFAPRGNYRRPWRRLGTPLEFL